MISYTKEELAEMIKNDDDITSKQIILTLKDVKELCRQVAAKSMNSPTAWAEKPLSHKWTSEVDMYAARILDGLILSEKAKIVKQLLLDS